MNTRLFSITKSDKEKYSQISWRFSRSCLIVCRIFIFFCVINCDLQYHEGPGCEYFNFKHNWIQFVLMWARNCWCFYKSLVQWELLFSWRYQNESFCVAKFVELWRIISATDMVSPKVGYNVFVFNGRQLNDIWSFCKILR